MELLYAGIVDQVNSVIVQIAALKWALILSGVGVVEGLSKRAVKPGAPKRSWVVPLLVGLMVGVVSYAADGAQADGILQRVAKTIESAMVYCGWVTFAYYFTLRPVKYAGDWIKRKSQGPGKEA